MLALELNETKHTQWTFRRPADTREYTIVRVIRHDDRVKLVLTVDGDVHMHTAGMADHVDVQPPAALTAAGVAEPMPDAAAPVDLLAGLDWAEQNLIVSGLNKLWAECMQSAERYGLAETAQYLADPRDVSALIKKLRDNARARNAA